MSSRVHRLSWLTVPELEQLRRDVDDEIAARRRRAPRARSPLPLIPNDLQRARARRHLGIGGTR